MLDSGLWRESVSDWLDFGVARDNRGLLLRDSACLRFGDELIDGEERLGDGVNGGEPGNEGAQIICSGDGER